MSSSTRQLEERAVVVTGSSSGIGRQIAITLAERGAQVILHSRTMSESLKGTEKTIAQAGGKCAVFPCDLQDASAFEKFVEKCWSWKGVVHSWVNNAGADILTGENAKKPFAEKLRLLWEVDVFATTSLSRLVVSRMKDAASRDSQQDFSIVNIGWDQADQGMEGDSGQLFGIAKGAVIAFTKSLAQDLAPTVRVNAIAPGWIRTEWAETASQDWQRRANIESLMNRWGSPADVAEVVAAIVDPKFSFVTGQVLKVNGGFRFGCNS